MNDPNTDYTPQLIRKLAGGFQKGTLLSRLTENSLGILSGHVDHSRAALETIVAAFEEIHAANAAITRNVSMIDANAREFIESSDAMQGSITERVEDIKATGEKAKTVDGLIENLVDNSADIRNVSSLIEDVSATINILAINASIEAARVGPAGAGFRVIASEIRNLAGRTADFAQDIAGTLVAFNAAIDGVEEQMRDFMQLVGRVDEDLAAFKQSFDENNAGAREIARLLASINDSMQEQSLALSDGIENLETASQNLGDTQAVSHALDRTHTEMDGLFDKLLE